MKSSDAKLLSSFGESENAQVRFDEIFRVACTDGSRKRYKYRAVSNNSNIILLFALLVKAG
jgi:hypothetical protein